MDKKTIEAKESEFSELHARMDGDKDLCYGKSFKMLTADDQEMPKVRNVTLPDAKMFARKTISVITAANQQVVVEGEDLKDKETTLIEEFTKDAYLEADNRLAKRGIVGMFPYQVEKSCARGHLAARCLVRVEEKQIVMDILPLDARYFIYDLGIDGFIWAAYKTTRSKARIQQEYSIDIASDKETVWDVWENNGNTIFIGEEVVTKPNPYKYIPFVWQMTPAGYMFGDSDNAGHEGESIFELSRDIFPQMNITATVLQTLNVKAIKPDYQYESEKGTQAKKPEKPPYGEGTVVPVDKEMGYKLFPIADIHAATRLFYAMFEGRLQRATMAATDLGNLTFPLSGQAIRDLSQKDDLILPRLHTLGAFYQQLSRMIIKQYQMWGIKAELGEEGYRRTYNPKDLNGEYTIKYRYFSTSPMEKLANYSVANAAGKLISDETKRRDILKLEDPDGEATKVRAELAEKLDPAIALYRLAGSLIDEDKSLEARLVAERLVMVLRQRQMGGEGIQPPEAEPEKKELPPLLGKGGGTPKSEAPESEEKLIREEPFKEPEEKV